MSNAADYTFSILANKRHGALLKSWPQFARASAILAFRRLARRDGTSLTTIYSGCIPQSETEWLLFASTAPTSEVLELQPQSWASLTGAASDRPDTEELKL